jgi:hypothetical protein
VNAANLDIEAGLHLALLSQLSAKLVDHRSHAIFGVGRATTPRALIELTKAFGTAAFQLALSVEA